MVSPKLKWYYRTGQLVGNNIDVWFAHWWRKNVGNCSVALLCFWSKTGFLFVTADLGFTKTDLRWAMRFVADQFNEADKMYGYNSLLSERGNREDKRSRRYVAYLDCVPKLVLTPLPCRHNDPFQDRRVGLRLYPKGPFADAWTPPKGCCTTCREYQEAKMLLLAALLLKRCLFCLHDV